MNHYKLFSQQSQPELLLYFSTLYLSDKKQFIQLLCDVNRQYRKLQRSCSSSTSLPIVILLEYVSYQPVIRSDEICLIYRGCKNYLTNENNSERRLYRTFMLHLSHKYCSSIFSESDYYSCAI